MKIVKLLFIDDPDWLWFIGDLKNRHPSESRFDPKRLLADEDLNIVPGILLEVIEGFAGAKRSSCYDSDPALCEKIKTMTASKEVDVVVIGNNRGVGVEKARAVAPDLRDRTIITWHRLPGDVKESLNYEIPQNDENWYNEVGWQSIAKPPPRQ